jgi:hypothetical protein
MASCFPEHDDNKVTVSRTFVMLNKMIEELVL